jgi:hypothetical protein
MAAFLETFDSYEAVGNREDLSDVIYNIDPTETPFQMMSGRGRASNRLHEWQIDSLATEAFNAQIEGDDIVTTDIPAHTPTTRLGNHTQISRKLVAVSGTQEVIDKAGRKSELAYQLGLKGKELKRDMELVLTQSNASVAGDATTARELGSLENWLSTNAEHNGVGATLGHTAIGVIGAVTDGAQRALTETLLKTVIQAIWTAGGEGTTVMVGPFNKTVISSFVGHGNEFRRNVDTDDKRFVTSIDVYVSDFGDHKIVPNRFQRDRTAFVLTPRLWGVDYLRSFRQFALSKTGDAEKRQLLCEYTLRSSNEAGSGKVAELNTA